MEENLSVYMQNLKSSTTTVIELCFVKKKKHEKHEQICENHVHLYFVPCVIIFCMQLLFTFFHLDALKGQVELKLKVKTENSLCIVTVDPL